MDREKVIKGIFQHCEGSMFDRCGECPYYEIDHEPFICRDMLLNDLNELLKEQEAVNPIVTPWMENEDGEVIVAKRECGRCGYQFFTERPNFCENCGTPILWD